MRLRARDDAVGRYVEVRVMLTRHSDQPGGYLSTPERSGASGWSEYRALPPGTYEVELTDYPCNGEMLFADDQWVRANLPPLSVTITPGAHIDQELRFDSRKIRAASSYKGKGGTQCGKVR